MPIQWLNGLDDVPPGQWNALTADNPFVQHAFLHQMQATGSAGPENGWQACHCTLRADGQLKAAAPGWIKHNSHGEFVFDWHWADFYQRNGLPYYPKLLVGSPYSPVPGPRLLAENANDAQALVLAQLQRATEECYSGVHWNFLQPHEARWLDEAQPGLIARLQWQFHWFNRGYENFDHFLSTLKRKRRKNILQERRRLHRYRFLRVHGHQATREQWAFAWQMYRRTFLEKGNPPAIGDRFFPETAQDLHYLLIFALEGDTPIACAIYLQGGDTLYGRYWGSRKKVPGLHFETCYYQAIEYCIEQKLARFEPGAQGEHKMARGFLPVPCWSRHWLRHAELAQAVKKHTQMETEMMLSYGAELAEHQPFQDNPLHDPMALG